MFLRFKKKIFLFKRSPHKKFGASKWALCAGGKEEGEGFEEGALRELFEETGLVLQPSDILSEVIFYNYGNEEPSTEWHVFLINCKTEPIVVLNYEHTEYGVFSCEEALKLDLMEGERQVVEHFADLFV